MVTGPGADEQRMRAAGPGRPARWGFVGGWRSEAEGIRASLQAPLGPVRSERVRKAVVLRWGRGAGGVGGRGRRAGYSTPGLREGVDGGRCGTERRSWEQVRLVAAGLGWLGEALRLLVRRV